MKKLFKSSKGFTLIELLIVIAVLGVLAAVVLVAINPAEQLERGRDASRLQAVAQIGHAAQAYATSQGQTLASYSVYNTATSHQDTFTSYQGTLPTGTAGWQDLLVHSQDIQGIFNMGPDTAVNAGVNGCALGGAAGASAQIEKGLCYYDNGSTFMVWTNAISGLYKTKASCPTATPIAVFIYDSTLGKAGVGCQAGSTTGVASNYPATGQTLH